MIKIIKKILGIINSIVLCFRFPFLYPRNRFSGKHEVHISWIMRLYNKLYKKSKDKFQLLFIFHEVYKEDDDPAYLCFYNVTIDRKSGDPRVINEAYPSLFSFNRADLAYKFHKNFKDLLKEASPLLF